MKRGKNKQMISKMIALLLVGCLSATALTGCGGSGKGGKDVAVKTVEDAYVNGEFNAKAITEGETLTIVVPANTLVKDWDTNAMTLKIEEEFGVDLKFQVLPSADYASKLNVMVMGGDELPDIIFNPQGWEEWAEEGAIVNLDEYYADENCSANIRAAEQRGGQDILKYLKNASGSYYILPQINQEHYASVKQKLWVYKPWLDELGLAVPQTLDEFYNACKKVLEKDMNGNGKMDEVALTGKSGLGGWFDCLMSSFVYAHDSGWRVLEDGEISFAFTTDEWKEGMKYIKKMFDNGLIPKSTLTQSDSAYNAIYLASDVKLFCFEGWNYTGTDLSIRQDYVGITSLKGPNGVEYSCYEPQTPSAGAVITKDCKNPLAAFLICDYMCNQTMSLTQRYGEQGVDWDYWDVAQKNYSDISQFTATFEGYDIVFYPYDMINYWHNAEAQNESYRGTGPFIRDLDTVSGAGVWVGAEDETQKMYAELEVYTAKVAMEGLENRPDEVIDSAQLTVDEAAEYSDVASSMFSYVEEIMSEFLVGRKDIDEYWDTYLQELENIGMSDYLDVLQTAYDRSH